MRSQEEILTDRVLSLFLLSSAGCDGLYSNIKFQKLVFLSEWNLIKKDIKAFHFKFFRYRLGPFSKELLLDQQELTEKGYITGGLALKEKAVDLLEYVVAATKDIRTNQEVYNTIEATCTEYGKKTALSLMDLVYKMKIRPHDMPGEEMPIRKIPAFMDIFVPEVQQMSQQFELPEYLLNDIAEDFGSQGLSEAEKVQLDKRTVDKFATALIFTMSTPQKERARDVLRKSNASPELIRKFS